ncbi:MAG: ABC transporter [Rhodobacteraceae bacterium]|nr:MAG: ABC transporter [Paracoccaceae bacterium]
MSGLLALLDDVAAIAKVAAASLDDIAAQATKAGSKAAVLVIDDAAVTPQYTHGFKPDRELPIVWRIAKGSIRNKLLILLPAGLGLSAFAPWAVTPLLMLGGGYLCYEGAEKVLQKYLHHEGEDEAETAYSDPAHLEEAKIAGAIKTDFILSAEIMTVSLAAIPESNIWMEGTVLATVGIGITILVYGGVALIVKADDLGLLMARRGRFRATRATGRGIVKFMPTFMNWLTIIGTAAMLWVGGSIIIHGLEVLGFDWLGHLIKGWSGALGNLAPWGAGFVEWFVTALMDGIFGVALGAAIIPLVSKVIAPLWAKLPKFKT